MQNTKDSFFVFFVVPLDGCKRSKLNIEIPTFLVKKSFQRPLQCAKCTCKCGAKAIRSVYDALPCISKAMRYKIRMSSGTYLSDKSMTLS